MVAVERYPNSPAKATTAGRGTSLMAAAFMFVAPLPVPGGGVNLRFGAVLAVLLLPVVIKSWRRSPMIRKVVWLAVATAVFGIFAGLLLKDAEQTWTESLFIAALLQLSTLALVAVGAFWAIDVIGMRRSLVIYSAGLVLNAVLTSTRFADNPWKFGLSLPVSIAVLILLARRGRGSAIFVLLLLGGASVIFETRSWLIVVIGALALLVLFRDRVQGWSAPRKLFFVLVSLSAVFILGEVISDLGASGALGDYVKSRTLRSLEITGNAVIGNRAEWGGAIALMEKHPLGVGTGVGPSSSDWSAVVNGLYLPEGLKAQSNVAQYLSEGYFSFHSGLWNMFSQFAIAGFVLVLILIVMFGKGVVELATLRSDLDYGARAAAIVMLVAVMWDLLFSPFSPWNVGVAIAITAAVSKGGKYFQVTGSNERT